MATRLRFATVGEVGIDLYLPAETRRLGGCSANVARAAAAAGADAHLFAPIGSDDRARDVVAALATTPITTHLRVEGAITALQKIKVDATGERELCGWEPGVVDTYRLDEAELAELATFDVIALAKTPAWRQCTEIGVGPHFPRIVADFSKDAPSAWDFTGLAIAFVGGTPDDLEALRPLSRDTLVVLTSGPHGAWAIDRGIALHQASVATNIVDTTGCGDAFLGAFTVAHFTGATLEAALLAGSHAAADVAARLGA